MNIAIQAKSGWITCGCGVKKKINEDIKIFSMMNEEGKVLEAIWCWHCFEQAIINQTGWQDMMKAQAPFDSPFSPFDNDEDYQGFVDKHRD